MILPGFPRPLPMKHGAPPFVLSGTFAADLDGWTGTATWNATSSPRTPPGVMILSNGNHVEYLLDKSAAAGLMIAFSIWSTSTSSSTITTRQFSYRIGGGPLQPGTSVANMSTSYVQSTFSFLNSGNDDVTIRIDVQAGGANSRMDDWTIAGTKP